MRGPLSRDRVLSAALDLADREGLAAVTMRGLGAVLDVQAMSLYHHLPGKEAVLAGLVDRIAGEIDDAIGRLAQPSDWRVSVRQRCPRGAFRHAAAPVGAAPDRLAHHDPLQRVPPLRGHPGSHGRGELSYQLAHRAMHALGSMVLGFVQELFSPVARGRGPKGRTADKARPDLARMAEKLPHVTRMVESELHANQGKTLGWCDSQAEFEFTLDLLLDGLEGIRKKAAG